MRRKPRKNIPHRAVRRKINKNRVKRNSGCSFFVVTFLLFLFSLVYIFAGDYIFPTRGLMPGENEVFVSFIDVGQGDSILIRSRDHAVLIDGGEHRAGVVVMDYLRQAGVSHLDYVVATHPHSDHIGGLITVLGRMEVSSVVMPDVLHNTITFENFLEVIENNNIPVIFPVEGDRIRAGIINLTVLAPVADFSGSSNNASIVIRLSHGQTSFLFTGDSEVISEQSMLSSGLTLSSDVLNLGHHGSRTSTSQAFLDAVDPSIVVISVGANNRYGHPHRDVMNRVEARNIRIYRTDHHGTIRMITNGSRISTR